MEACVEVVFPAPNLDALSLSKALVEPPEAERARSSEAPALPVPTIVHVDVDAFFASVEQMVSPKLRGKAVLVGRGVVISASHEAALHGVTNGMTFREAMRLCPQATVVPGRYERYAEYAERLRGILEAYSPVVEVAALDDFYLDFAGTQRIYPDLRGTLLRLQMDVFQRTGLSISIGAARTKVVAAIASRLERPRGLRLVAPGTEQEFLAPLPVERLDGIGHVHASMLANRGVTTIGELSRVPRAALEAAFGGVIGGQIWKSARGLGTGGVAVTAAAKYVSREATIEGGSTDTKFLGDLIGYLCGRISATLRKEGRQARSLGLRIRHLDHFSAHHTMRLLNASNDDRVLQKAALELFRELFTREAAIRLIGITAGNLDAHHGQNELFGQPQAGACG